jgi:CheY-like chemotaxis protein
MNKRVLDIGNCAPDHAAIRQMIESRFAATVEQAHEAEEVFARLRAEPFDLVLINRKLDADYSDGLAIIQQIKADPELCEIPVMLITNYPEHQQRAIASGALPGFGKQALQNPTTFERLRGILNGMS